MKFDLDARPTIDGFDGVDVYAILELASGERTRWTSGGLNRANPPISGQWTCTAYPEDASAEEPLLKLTREEAIGLANVLYAAAGLSEVPDEPSETRDTWDEIGNDLSLVTSDPPRDNLLGFFGTYDKISLERHKPEIIG